MFFPVTPEPCNPAPSFMSHSAEQIALKKKQRQNKSRSALTGLLAAALLAASHTGCSVFLAATQPPKKNLSLLQYGTPRSRVLAEFGTPTSSRMVNWTRVDTFNILQGYSREMRAGRAIAHGTADLLTGGLWELAGTPAEMVFDGKRLHFEVTYDAQDRVIGVLTLESR